MQQVLVIFGGGSTEHEVSRLSAQYIQKNLQTLGDISTHLIEMNKDQWLTEQGESCYLNYQSQQLVINNDTSIKVDYVIPCIHGYPGETGDIQSLLELAKLPYLGCGGEASCLSFNKISSKLWYDALGVANTPYLFINQNTPDSYAEAQQALAKWQGVFVKAASQGSSVGCYSVTNECELTSALDKAFGYSDQVLIEKKIKPREIELAAYEFNGELYISYPGEVHTPQESFYTYEEKYSAESHSTTDVRASNLTDEQVAFMQTAAKKVFSHMKLKDLSRVDFFLTEQGDIYLNEVNTFPGMTPISMFPKMMEANGHRFVDFLKQAIDRATVPKA